MKFKIVFYIISITLFLAQANSNVDKVVNDLIATLENVREGALSWDRKDGGTRNHRAVVASTSSWNAARELRFLEKTALTSSMQKWYDHTKYWEHKFNVEWGGHHDTYAGYCYGVAKDAFYKALTELKALGLRVMDVNTHVVSIFESLHPRPGGKYEMNVSKKSGYAGTNSVDRQLHSKISSKLSASMNKYIARFETSISAELAASLRKTTSIKNIREESTEQTLSLDLSVPVYVYQTKFSSTIADGTTVSGWGSGLIVSNEPIM